MTAGGIGNGLSYWATINIRGNLTKDQLQTVVKQIKEILGGDVDGESVDGEVVHASRLANTSQPEISVNINTVRDRDG